ncbi:Undecaprenyl-diphosphatase [Paramagnetospirillum magnetotacticum MS-1]|uniref:Undecaprenyl-diphosphatase n=1 Tax=Paramagnetospirillum magnetotacticum MS-1 TaxID=272627 RepID=A0A0C2U7D5_PARME|nr:undecaprenyl-diphosphate phosphatase [Paramagnetospirillum magnetotacticum]KIL97382.1 Undecaprenyl-diphosphatase [Paramagnetospirillum magnetotacticum MS-1]
MTFLEVLVVALIQGLGEVLPLGAAGSLAALPRLAAAPEGRAALSVAAHAGTLLALMAYFWRDVLAMSVGLWRLAKGKPDYGSHLLLHVLAGTIPAAVIGWMVLDRSHGLVGQSGAAIILVIGGVLLWGCDKLGVTVRRVEHITWLGAIGLGALQILSLIPGVSRTGITITVARLLGWERQSAIRLSMLLAMPLILGHGIKTFWSLAHQTQLVLSSDLLMAMATAGLTSFLGLAGMMAWVARNTFAPFAVVRIGFGLAVLVLVYFG